MTSGVPQRLRCFTSRQWKKLTEARVGPAKGFATPRGHQLTRSNSPQLYLRSGVRSVWLVDPDEKAVRIHRTGRPPQLFNESDVIADPEELPGLNVDLSRVFR
jgi:hypothetical protein